MPGQVACRLCGRSFELRGRASAIFCKGCNDKADREVGRVATVQCGECGKEFTTRTRCTKYCSDACRIEARRRHGRENMRRYMSDPEKRAVAIARQRAQFAARRGAAREDARGQSQQGAGIRRAAPRPSRAAPPSRATCKLCGRGFEQYGRSRRRSYCKHCAAKADREMARTLRVDCKECGRKFSTRNRSARYCSPACRADGSRRLDRESGRKRLADPRKHVLVRARSRALLAANKDQKAGRTGGRGGRQQQGAARGGAAHARGTA